MQAGKTVMVIFGKKGYFLLYGFENRAHLPIEFRKRQILYAGQGWQKDIFIKKDDGVSMNVNGSTQQAGADCFRNMKAQKSDGKAEKVRTPRADRVVNVTISKEGIESLQNGGKVKTYEGIVCWLY